MENSHGLALGGLALVIVGIVVWYFGFRKTDNPGDGSNQVYTSASGSVPDPNNPQTNPVVSFVPGQLTYLMKQRLGIR